MLNIISKLTSSKANDDFDLEVSFKTEHKNTKKEHKNTAVISHVFLCHYVFSFCFLLCFVLHDHLPMRHCLSRCFLLIFKD